MKLAYYPGCSLDSTAIEYGVSTRRTAEIMGIDLIEIDDWNCCGATSGHNTNRLLSLALPARNLALAEKTGLDVLAPCAACYSRFRATEHAVRSDANMRSKIEQVIDMEYTAANKSLSILELLDGTIGTEGIKQKVTNPLKGMKAACYYGCLLVRPVEYTGFDDPEDPQSMDRIVRALGADTVEWSYKTECCGAALATSRPDIGKQMIYQVLRNAADAGAECIVTACPLCMMNLDMRQEGAAKLHHTKFDIPIYYVTELVAIACGDSPEAVGVNRHFVEANSYLGSLAEKAARLEAASAKDDQTDNKGGADNDKKIAAFIKGFEKNPEKMAARILKDEEKAKVLAEVVNNDEKKIAKLAELMVTDSDKALKVAEAFVAGELKKREKANN